MSETATGLKERTEGESPLNGVARDQILARLREATERRRVQGSVGRAGILPAEQEYPWARGSAAVGAAVPHPSKCGPQGPIRRNQLLDR